MSQTLQVVSTDATRQHISLAANGQSVAGLTIKSSFRNIYAVGNWGNEEWKFTRKGLLSQNIEVGSGSAVVGQYKPRPLRGSRLNLNGKTYELHRTRKIDLIKLHYQWQDSEDREIITYEIGGAVKFGGQIVISDELYGHPDAPVLSLLGLYVALGALSVRGS